jgi:hypothetical protein
VDRPLGDESSLECLDLFFLVLLFAAKKEGDGNNFQPRPARPVDPPVPEPACQVDPVTKFAPPPSRRPLLVQVRAA